MSQIIYTAYFVKDPQKLLSQIPSRITGTNVKTYAHHLTKEFRPKSGLKHINPGHQKTVYAFAQVVTDRTHCVLVKSFDESNLSINTYPHITIATVDGVEPRESNKAIAAAYASNEVEEIYPEIAIDVIEGYFDGKNVHLA